MFGSHAATMVFLSKYEFRMHMKSSGLRPGKLEHDDSPSFRIAFQVTVSLVPADSARLCPWSTSLPPVPTPKTPVPPSSQPKGLFVHCRTSPCISPLSLSPPLKPQSPPVPNLNGCLLKCTQLIFGASDPF